jgi:alkylation response protein AidB-like acyl-CoA dehydrogenase
MQAMFDLDATQALVQASLTRWLADHAGFERRAGLQRTPEAIMPLWRGLSQDLGLLGAALPEAVGGQGGGLPDQGLILQALGHALLPEPYAACAVLGAGLLQRLPGELPRQLLAGVVDGAVRPVLAALEPGARHDLAQVHSTLHAADPLTAASAAGPAAATLSGRKALVRAAPCATHWLVSARDAAGLLRLAVVSPGAAGITRRDLRLADGGWAAELAFDRTPVQAVLGEPGCDLLPLIEQASDETQLVSGAEAIGVMQRLLQGTLDHVRQRKQFGVAIASFQVTQHRLADMHMALLQANALVGATLLQLDRRDRPALPSAQRRTAVASAQVAVARACRAVGQGAVQLHGGMGMTDELVIGHGFKRLTLIEGAGGGVDAQLRRVAAETNADAETAAK